MKIFSRFNDFLNHSVEYLDNRIITGKFILDLYSLLRRFIKFNIAVDKRIYFFLRKVGFFKVLISIGTVIWNLLMKIPLLNRCVQMITDLINIVISCYSQIFIVFAITFTATFLLLDWFQSAIVLFFIAFIPVILVNNFFVSALYYNIKDCETNGKISFWQDIKVIAPRFIQINTPLVVVSALIIESFVAYFLIIFCISEIFTLVHVPWSGSVLFWFVFVGLSCMIVAVLFTVILVMQQSYFLMLFKRLPMEKAIVQSRQQIKQSLFYYLFFNIIFYISSAFLIWRALLTSLYIGFTLELFFALTVGSLLAFLLYRQFENEDTEKEMPVKTEKKNNIVFIIIIAGFINYLLIASLAVNKYESILTFIQDQQDNYLAQLEMKLYSNKTYGYSLEYPDYWTVYQWSNKSVTFYNNYTRTLSGGTWLNVTISPYNQNYFEQLYYDSPGITNFDAKTGDVTTKVTDTTIQNYQTVNYTYIKSELPYKQYETHYLIHKNNLLYDISFVSLTNDVSSYNTNLFQKIITSITFTN